MSREIEVAPGIVAHPQICSGTPCVRGRRIGSLWIAGWFYSGESILKIAADYHMPVDAVEQAIRYEYSRLRKRGPEMRAVTRGGKSVLITDREALREWKRAEEGRKSEEQR